MLPAVFALLLVRSAAAMDQGIYPELNQGVAAVVPTWQVAAGQTWLRLDTKHKLLTLYQGDAALAAYRLQDTAAVPTMAPVSAQALLPLLASEEATELRSRITETTQVLVAAPPPSEDQDHDGIVNALDVLYGAKKLCLNKAAYVSNYRTLKYPGGDVPRTEGVCTDTLVRALRNAGWDAQRGVHVDALKNPGRYPLEKKAPDANIDHRRIRMLLPWFRQVLVAIPEGQPLRPGDILLFDTFPSKAGPDHAGIVSDRLGSSEQPLIINNWTDGYVEQEMDILPLVPVTHRFRVPGFVSGAVTSARGLPPLRP
jgi:uncharacterized protein YijF (DUF1287 family)